MENYNGDEAKGEATPTVGGGPRVCGHVHCLQVTDDEDWAVRSRTTHRWVSTYSGIRSTGSNNPMAYTTYRIFGYIDPSLTAG